MIQTTSLDFAFTQAREHRVKIVNGVLCVEPPLRESRFFLHQNLKTQMAAILDLPRPHTSHMEARSTRSRSILLSAGTYVCAARWHRRRPTGRC